jgi:[acyl-carrier-protein] S-malonyltransferase
MGKDFYETFPVARWTFEEADEIVGRRLSRILFEGPAAELTLTKNSQPAIYVVSIAIWRVLSHLLPSLRPAWAAGLSLGEYTALTAIGSCAFAHCLPLVQARADYMQAACEEVAGGMQVVLGLDEERVQQTLEPLSGVWVANLNCPGQVVIAGTREGLSAAAEPLKAAGAKRVLPLEVSGAFHSELMRPARERLAPLLEAVPLEVGCGALVMNVSGAPADSMEEVRRCLMQQVTSPVRWEKGIRRMAEEGAELFVEMGCGKTLAGMNKRIGVPVPTYSVEKVEELEPFLEEQTCSC